MCLWCTFIKCWQSASEMEVIRKLSETFSGVNGVPLIGRHSYRVDLSSLDLTAGGSMMDLQPPLIL